MRVGRPVKAMPQPLCDYCGAKATLVRPDETAYPYREDHGSLWLCAPCGAWIGVVGNSVRNLPLGRLANAELRELKARLHAAFEPMIAAKVRRDSVNAFEARSKGYKWLAGVMGIDEKACQINQLDAEHCRRAIEIVERPRGPESVGRTE
jgi:hypothetical protein